MVVVTQDRQDEVATVYAEALDRAVAASAGLAEADPVLACRLKPRAMRRYFMRCRRRTLVRTAAELDVPHWRVKHDPRRGHTKEGRDPRLVAEAATVVAFADDGGTVPLELGLRLPRIRLVDPVFQLEPMAWCSENDPEFALGLVLAQEPGSNPKPPRRDSDSLQDPKFRYFGYKNTGAAGF